jgi:hypothetical protein
MGGLENVSAGEEVAHAAGRLCARYYHRARRPLSMADCLAPATAAEVRERLASPDPALVGLAVELGFPWSASRLGRTHSVLAVLTAFGALACRRVPPDARLRDHEPVASGVLGRVEGRIGPRDQFVG